MTSPSRGTWLMCGATALVVLAFALGGFPLGVPGEWTWNWSPFPPDFPLSLISLSIVAGAFGGWVWLGAQRLPVCSRWETPVWLLGLVLVGYWWLSTLQEAGPAEMRLSKAAWVLYYPGASGYFTEARKMSEPLPEYLAHYEHQMAQGDVLHLGTHPPGLILLYRGLLSACDQWPALREWGLASQPATLREALEIVAINSRDGPTPLTPTDRATLWLAAAATQFLCVMTVLPLYWLLRRDWSPRASWQLASLWPTVPALAVFLPKSDSLYPLFGMLILALWINGWSRGNLAGRIWCGLAGLTTCAGLMLSLALLPTLCLLTFITLWDGWLCQREQRIPHALNKLAISGLCYLTGLLSPIVFMWWGTGLNLPAVWIWNLHNHAGFYGQFSRTYWAWLLVNPIELTAAVGLPAMMLTAFSARRMLHDWQARHAGVIWSCLGTWALLWMSGKNSGEAARLWIVLMPWVIWSGAAALKQSDADCDGRKAVPPTGKIADPNTVSWGFVWSCQMVLAVTIALRVLGFHVPGITD